MPDHAAASRPSAHRAALLSLMAVAAVVSSCYAGEPGYEPVRPLPSQTGAAVEVPARAVDAPATVGYTVANMPVALPAIEREFRGVWVATVGNLDWPSRRSLSSAQAQAELIRILDAARDQGLNAVILQVRPMGDAFYDSGIEPWSDFLTGASGLAPEPYWDPLAFAIEQAHARGLELHAWFNPFRASFVSKRTPLAPNHVTKRRPDLVRTYGTFYWMDPGEPDARQLALDVITDVVRRYDLDAVHIDDYFYPYQQRDARNRIIPFPDDATWNRIGRHTGLSRDDWRRSNVDTFIEQMYKAVRAEKQHVRVGISPFGIWRPGHPASVRGLDSYRDLYADSRKWLVNGWADYYAPQLYWRTHAPQQPYTDLMQWWSEQNPLGRHIWAGNIPNNINSGERGWRASEILEQVQLTREHPGITGNVHFSVTGLLRNPDGLSDAFATRVYATPALVPASPWLGNGTPRRPHVDAAMDEGLHATSLRFHAGAPHTSRWIVRVRHTHGWETLLLPKDVTYTHVDWRDGAAPAVIAVSYTDAAGIESQPTILQLSSAN